MVTRRYSLRLPGQADHAALNRVWAASQQHDDPLHAIRGTRLGGEWSDVSELLEIDGQVVGGFSYAYNPADGRAAGRIALLSDYRDDRAAGVILDALCQRATADGARTLRLFMPGVKQWIESAARDRGIQPVRTIFRMVRPPDVPLPSPRIVAGMRVRPMRPGEEQAVLEALNLAWSTTWGYQPITRDMLKSDIGDHPEAFLLGVEEEDDTHVVGTCHPILRPGEKDEHGRPWGWISNVTTIPAWQGRGVARALLLTGLARLYQQGVGSVGLGVDGGNDAPVGLYRSVGFEVAAQSVVWEHQT